MSLGQRGPNVDITIASGWVQDAKVMSWWDYGYQITAMANRTILVDNNTWNNTHISRVGQVGSCRARCLAPRQGG